MKKLISIFLGVVAVFVLALVSVFYFTADMVTSADEFFLAVKDKNIQQAYTYLSEDFQASTSEIELENYLQKNRIHKYKEASWESRSMNGGRGSLTGSITTESGGVVPITLNFVNSDNGWKIYSIQKPSSGIQEESTPLALPSEQGQVALVNEAMLVFAESVNEKSMSKLHKYSSNLFQKQFGVEKLDEAFGTFYELGIDLTLLKDYSPIFEEKVSIDEEGKMTIKGFYPTQPNKVHFTLSYAYEGLGWKLIRLGVNIK